MTADLISPTTQLEAVNWALGVVGFPPVGTLTGTIGRDASSALAWLSQSTRDLCLKGLWFARRATTIAPNDSGHIILPDNCLSIASPDQDDLAGLNVSYEFCKYDWMMVRPVMRQGKLFSVINQSYVWTKPVTFLMREGLAFEDIPMEARQYAMVQSASFLNGGTLRSPDVDKRLQPLLTLTWDALETAEIENSRLRFL